MRIAVTTPTFFPVVGGAEVGIHEIYDRLGARHHVSVITREHPQRILDEYAGSEIETGRYSVVVPLNRALKRLPGRAGYLIALTGIPMAIELVRAHRRAPISALNAHFARPSLLPLLVARYGLGARTVLSLVGRADVIDRLLGIDVSTPGRPCA